MNPQTKHNIAYTCGGTGGHIYPLIALAQELTETHPFFIGSRDRVDRHIIPAYGFSFFSITSSNRNIFKIIQGFFQARRLLKNQKASLLVSSGGYLTLPVVLAAKSLSIPIFLLEQNSLPGRVNRSLGKFAKKICLSFESSQTYFKTKNKIVTGNPVRKIFLEDPTYISLKELTLGTAKTLLVFGGSQGAQKINALFSANYAHFMRSDMQLIHITGKNAFESAIEASKKLNPKAVTYSHDTFWVTDAEGHVKIITTAYCEKMDWLYEHAHWVISRAGATTIAELIHFQKPAIVIPYPHAKDNHQVDNANEFVKTHLGKCLAEEDLTFDVLLREVQALPNPFLEPSHHNARTHIADLIRKELILCTPK
jgi:UDP-N-acetylglucosamine--N-acetylmuramyl-(pentapeptide) pyrophosphoryl-undecaprenol N-acetylglucosamine transferase